MIGCQTLSGGEGLVLVALVLHYIVMVFMLGVIRSEVRAALAKATGETA